MALRIVGVSLMGRKRWRTLCFQRRAVKCSCKAPLSITVRVLLGYLSVSRGVREGVVLSDAPYVYEEHLRDDYGQL